MSSTTAKRLGERRYLFCSSAGVYKKSFELPHIEGDVIDPNSRHKVHQMKEEKKCDGYGLIGQVPDGGVVG